MRTANLYIWLAMWFFLLAMVPAAAGRIIHVDADANGANDGSSWADAFTDLQDALSIAQFDEIRVAQGVYTPAESAGDRTATFQLINGVSIKGGYAGFGEPDPNARNIELYETILSGDLFGNDGPDFAYNGENSYHVVTGSGTDANAVLDGFTITGGNAHSSGGPPPTFLEDQTQSEGGGMYNSSSSPMVTNCTFSGNFASSQGGGMYNNQSNPTLTNCTFNGNSAGSGGAIYNLEYSNLTLTNCTFNGNSAEGSGGAINNREYSNPTLTNCTFTGNMAWADGGGMHNDNSNPTLTNCTFTGNWASTAAGGMGNRQSNPTLTNCTFTGNSARIDGGGMRNSYSNPTLTDCTFTGNWTYTAGGGMHNHESNPTLTNCTFTGNWTSTAGAGMQNFYSDPTLTNCTFSGNSADKGAGMYNGESNPTLTNCTFSENTAAGRGGGMHNAGSTPSLISCKFYRNSTSTYGGGMYNHESSPTLTNCTFSDNSATNLGGSYGGGIYTGEGSRPLIRNCVFIGNSARGGGGIYNWSDSWYPSYVEIEHCTFSGNTATVGGGGLWCQHTSTTVVNCIFWGNRAIDRIDESAQIIQAVRPLVINYSCVQGWTGTLGGTGNIDVDPCFAAPGYWVDVNEPNIPVEPNDPNAFFIQGDYHLQSQAGRWDPNSQTWVTDTNTSPCIDAGDPNLDWTAELWPHGKRINMGAYGGTPQASMSLSDTGNIANLNTDEFVGYADMMQFANKWLHEAVLLVEDLNRDEIVNFPDFAIFADNWKPPQPGQSSNPDPPNSANDVSVTADLSWTAGPNTTSHDVYFGTSSPPSFLHNQTGTTFDPGTMAVNTTYYWRIDEVNPSGTAVGVLWTFKTRSLPEPAINPYPYNRTSNVNTNADLSWTAGAGATSHDVYFGTTNPPPFIRNQTATTFDPGTMAENTTYYWRIDAVNAYGTTTGTVWYFTTAGGPPPI